MQNSTYKGKDIFVSSANSEYVSIGGRAAEMSFGIQDVQYTELYTTGRLISDTDGPSDGDTVNLVHLPSEAVLAPADTARDGRTGKEFLEGKTYEILAVSNGLSGGEQSQFLTDTDLTAASQIAVGSVFTVTATTNTTTISTGQLSVREIDPGLLTTDIEAVQKKINTARVQAGSQYAALESAVGYTTDLTAQYELGYNTVNDVNFSMETAHLAKNQILQQAATAMLAQANSGQQGLLQLLQA
jgi:flagellin